MCYIHTIFLWISEAQMQVVLLGTRSRGKCSKERQREGKSKKVRERAREISDILFHAHVEISICKLTYLSHVFVC